MTTYIESLGLTLTGTNADPSRLIDWFDFFAGKDEPLNSFKWLSNFYVGEPLVYEGEKYITGEHMFQAYKATTDEHFHRVQNALTPSEAKALGRSIPLRPDWETVKYDVMRSVLQAKFKAGSELGARLQETGSAILVEGTYWHDDVWGVKLNVQGWPGRNWLGHLLMARRAELAVSS